MINSSLGDYAFIRACILFLQSITPISVVYTLYELSPYSTSWHLPLIFRVWFATETAFYLAFQLPYFAYLQRDAVHPPLQSRDDRRRLFERSIASASSFDLEHHIRWWFKGAKVEDVGRESVKSWLAWAFFEGRMDADGKDMQELEEYTSELERQQGKPFSPGTGKAVPLRLTLDPIALCRRSLLWYFCVGFVDFLTYVRLCTIGYHFHRLRFSSFFTLFPFRPVALTATKQSPVKHLTYWHRAHTSKTRLPVLFIHGIGIGLYPYVNFLQDLNEHVDDGHGTSDGQIGIIAIEIMPISFRITHAALGREEMCREIATILKYHGFDKYVLVSHSYGSVLATHILNNNAMQPRVGSSLFIDPVCFMLHRPDVAYNFTIRQPTHANEYQLWYFASQDPGVAHTLGRRFFWSENALWAEDLMPLVRSGMRVTVSLAGRDLIVDTKAVGNYLAESAGGTDVARKDSGMSESEERASVDDDKTWQQKTWTGDGLEVLWFDDTDHAQVFDTKTKRARLVKVVRTYCEGL